MLIILFFTLGLLFYGILEFRAHQRNLRAIPLRIHVNGTRGKSSVTRLIAATLRAGGYRTYAKATGTLPRIIDEKGLEVPILRPHRANIIEQLKIVRYISKRKPDAAVIECMAVLPEYQWICEHQIIKANIGVITNSRPDHLREMGPTIENITRSLCNTLPDNGVLFTAEKRMFPLMAAEAKKKGVQLIQVDETIVPEEAMNKFDHLEHRENVAIAIAIADHLKIPREKAMQGMYESHPDVGALRFYRVYEANKEVRFVNALAANDPESTLAIWERVKEIYPNPDTIIMMLNTRADRFDRSLQLLEMIGANIQHDYVVSIGEKTAMLIPHYKKYNIERQKAIELGLTSCEAVFHKIFEITEKKAIVLAMGNMGAGGLEVAHYFRDHGKSKENNSG
jgi:gamma-polyglutamate synthase